MDLFDPNVPPALAQDDSVRGPHSRGTFATEFGCSVFSSFESMAPTLKSSKQHIVLKKKGGFLDF